MRKHDMEGRKNTAMEAIYSGVKALCDKAGIEMSTPHAVSDAETRRLFKAEAAASALPNILARMKVRTDPEIEKAEKTKEAKAQRAARRETSRIEKDKKRRDADAPATALEQAARAIRVACGTVGTRPPEGEELRRQAEAHVAANKRRAELFAAAKQPKEEIDQADEATEDDQSTEQADSRVAPPEPEEG